MSADSCFVRMHYDDRLFTDCAGMPGMPGIDTTHSADAIQ